MQSSDEKCIQNFSSENPKVSDLLENVGAEGKIILKYVLKE
jgi:hypothetical protein